MTDFRSVTFIRHVDIYIYIYMRVLWSRGGSNDDTTQK